MSIRYVISLTNGFHVALRLFSITQWCKCYECRDWWSLSMIYWSTDTWMMSRLTWFLCFVQHHGARFSKCLWDYFWLSKWKPWETAYLRLACYFFVFNLFWRLLWSITNKRAHGNMESLCFIQWSEKKTDAHTFLTPIDCWTICASKWNFWRLSRYELAWN